MPQCSSLKEGDTTGVFALEYDHSLNSAGDYIGFTADIDDGADYYSASADYYGKLASGNYIRAGIGYAESDGDDTFAIGGAFYFSAATDVNFIYENDSEAYVVGAKHYFNSNVALSASYGDSGETDGFSVSLIGHF